MGDLRAFIYNDIKIKEVTPKRYNLSVVQDRPLHRENKF